MGSTTKILLSMFGMCLISSLSSVLGWFLDERLHLLTPAYGFLMGYATAAFAFLPLSIAMVEVRK